MPHVQARSQVKRNGHHTRAEVKQTAGPAMARDDLREAFAGDQNNSNTDGTHVKSRKSKASKLKTPKR